ncbi:MAG: VCBS repeat-containing protein [Planctomycetes bacterium]|nr:VCBS repeat-containing protein [Planctomycetota bacterium]
MRKTPFAAAALALGTAMAALAGAALLLRAPRASRSGGLEAPGGTALLPPGTQVQVPAPAGSVEDLRAKVAPGGDRFVVEEADEAIEPRLEVLKRAFLEPGSETARAAAAEVLAEGFTARGIPPGATREILAEDGLAVREGLPGRGAPERAAQGAGGFLRAIGELIAPLERLEGAAFKVIQVLGDPASGALASTAIFELSGGLDGGRRWQWTGTADLSWRLTGTAASPGWRLSAWEMRDVLRAELEAKPFADVTEAALGASPVYRDLLVPGIDEFRARLDAATGIDVYGHHGAAAGDFDSDGIDDLYVCMPPGLPNVLFRGRGDGTFADQSRGSGADVVDGTHHALFLDLENDGDQDLFLVTETGALVLRNEGGTFREAPGVVPPIAAARSTPISAAAADHDLDGDLDVYLCAYVFWRGAVGEVGSRLPFPYHEARNGAPNFLFRNRGDGTFEDATPGSGLDRDNDRFSFAAAWGDADGDGDPDLYVANDFGSNQYYRNDGGGRFTEAARESGIEDVGAGMSVAWEDYDSDGDLDLYVGNMLSSAGRRVTGTPDYKASSPSLQALYRRHARGNSLFRNRGDGTFEEVSEASRAYFGRWAWASGFVDFNLDGREDIFVQNGFITNARKDDL